jgi:hypothetical protein
MDIANDTPDPHPVCTMRTHHPRIDWLLAGVASILSLGRPVDDSAMPTVRVKEAPEGRAIAEQARSPVRAIVRAPGRNQTK